MNLLLITILLKKLAYRRGEGSAKRSFPTKFIIIFRREAPLRACSFDTMS